MYGSLTLILGNISVLDQTTEFSFNLMDTNVKLPYVAKLNAGHYWNSAIGINNQPKDSYAKLSYDNKLNAGPYSNSTVVIRNEPKILRVKLGQPIGNITIESGTTKQ